MVKNKHKIGLVIYHDDLNSSEFLIEVLSNVLGYHYTQAANCVHYITTQGEYMVKGFTSNQKVIAEAMYELIIKQQIPARLIPL